MVPEYPALVITDVRDLSKNSGSPNLCPEKMTRNSSDITRHEGSQFRCLSDLHIYYYRIFWCIARYYLLFGRPGAGYIKNAGYTLLKSEIATGYFFKIMVLFASKRVVFSVLHGQEPSLGHVEIAATSGA